MSVPEQFIVFHKMIKDLSYLSYTQWFSANFNVRPLPKRRKRFAGTAKLSSRCMLTQLSK